ncbi:MAG: hypothetical protein UW46_C0003G0018 [Candidatus Yanofskybacteria bacterium GW2011_GWF1_44_227]|uniref:Uncharacterized protein n=1 Tax=Candidatus Yanofskybacteria bacterium GW2011_GWE2_40_11 TaxID=1619033 RepID=A0A0G0TTK1_9BACT|nr:MAG: hypothetical protein UT69_C0008G0039 [Candidatus Yanofskybacteria bacterium GW2011_GWE1_40_10]KKR41207.1 MAG: hypothetical protein UT75_C0001G0111 [Candidatus Yanofskybacteria bacterium GW2011_GWE2_40_11]KKT15715.1 MAG: hypothetical protein UV97_C0003G0047 [Candidatus Yanofskybacteria bacterium GW2011_GWF2_43_596]KKT53397.1 MAG: hypothetical protein UW46_C0003G0018 [Candidatus Yanofskybacteria bacterium GW2011_GWF1_44_227]OGN38706.1 MAG: hypothetical protein A2371_03100 [Candidatus Yano
METKCSKCQMLVTEMKCKTCSVVVPEAEVETHACGKENVVAVCDGCKLVDGECTCAVAACATCSKLMEECVCEA